jgi:hypothetical protein
MEKSNAKRKITTYQYPLMLPLKDRRRPIGCILHEIPPKVKQCNIIEIVVVGCFEMVHDVKYDKCCDTVDMNLLIA